MIRASVTPTGRRVRVLLVTGSFPPMPCGVGDYTASLASALAARGDVQVGVLTDVRAAEAAAALEMCRIADRWRLRDLGPVLRAIRSFRPDLVHVQYPTRGFGQAILPELIPTLAAAMRIIVVQTWHEPYARFGWRLRNVPKAVIGGGLVAVRPRFLESLHPAYRWLSRRKLFRMIPNASSLPIVKPSEGERAAIRTRYAADRRLVVFFGFASPSKRVELLYDIADPGRDHLVITSAIDQGDPYHAMIVGRSRQAPWAGNVTLTGTLPPLEAAGLLSAADAVVLPFEGGGGEWNTSLQAARDQGTFVLTTSSERRGLGTDNIYYCDPSDVGEMRGALSRLIGRRREPASDRAWAGISGAHLELYRELLDRRGPTASR